MPWAIMVKESPMEQNKSYCSNAKTVEALGILGADKPYGDNVKRTLDRDLDKDQHHDSKEYP